MQEELLGQLVLLCKSFDLVCMHHKPENSIYVVYLVIVSQ